MSAAILGSWRELARHASGCESGCAPVERELARVPEQPSRADGAAHERLCATGQELFVAWYGAKNDWLAGTEDMRVRQFLTSGQLWDDGVTFAVRARAIMGMPGPAFRAWLELEDTPRRLQLRALEAAVQASTAQAERAAVSASAGRSGRAVGAESTGPAAVHREGAADRERATTRSGWRRPGGSRSRAVLEPTED